MHGENAAAQKEHMQKRVVRRKGSCLHHAQLFGCVIDKKAGIHRQQRNQLHRHEEGPQENSAAHGSGLRPPSRSLSALLQAAETALLAPALLLPALLLPALLLRIPAAAGTPAQSAPVPFPPEEQHRARNENGAQKEHRDHAAGRAKQRPFPLQHSPRQESQRQQAAV